jgi:phosphate uptake regulator
MEYRKLIKFGNSSHVISLPKTWLDKQGIKKGDIIYFEENEKGDIIISSKEYKDTDEGKNLKIDIDGLTNKEIQLEIVSGYIKEFRKIILTGKEIKTKATEIRKILHELIGIEIIEQTKSKIIAKDFLNICEIRLEDLRKRLNSVVTNMIKDSKLGGEDSNYKDIKNRDHDANKFTYVLLRVIRRGLEKPNIRKSIGLTKLELAHEQHTVLAMERIADIAKWISRTDHEADLTDKEIEELNKIHAIVLDNYRLALNSYIKKDYTKSCNAVSINKEIQASCDKAKINLKSSEAFKITHLLREMSNNIAIIGEAGFMNTESNIGKIFYEEKEHNL